jgi:hypothetical protein
MDKPYQTNLFKEDILEKEIERRVSIHAKNQGWLSYKFTSPTTMGVPDRIYIKNGQVIFIEFKSPGKWLRAKQVDVIARMREKCAEVFVIDTVEGGIALFDEIDKYEI